MYNGILVINKPSGISSHAVVARLRKILGEKKIGHGGTLDPMASGVLPVFIGRATRAAGCIQEGGKTYVADMRLGISTDTQDTTGTVLEESGDIPSRTEVEKALEAFRGEITQLPPMYSAVSVGGVRLYKLARQGVEVERETRQVTVYGLEILDVRENGDYVLKIDCSKGLYVRTLIDDLGKMLGCGAAMSALVRTRAGIFEMEEALTLDEVEELKASGELDSRLSCADRLFSSLEAYTAPEELVPRLKNGQHVPLPNLPDGELRLYGSEGFLGLMHAENGVAKMEKSFY